MRKLKIKINDKDYTLEMNRNTVKWLEANGFDLEQFGAKPVTYYDLLWTSLFLVNHRDVNPNLALKLMESYSESKKSVAKVVAFAIDEYTSFIDALAGTNSTETDEELEIIEA